MAAPHGDRHPRVRSLGQAFVVCVAGLVMLRAFYNYDANITLAAGIWTLVCALYAAAGLFTGVVYVVVLYASLVALIILIEVLSLPHLSQRDEALFAKDAIWGLVATLMIVASERALVHARRLKLPWRCSPQDWLSKRSMNRVTVFAGVGTLIMAVLSLRLLPDLRRFYFTGAMVVAAFVWIVFGFLFNEPVYRKSGFVLLCFGIVKGLIWDVLSIKNTVYRQVSWTVLGLLALAASFLYNKFRTRLGGENAEE